MLNRNSTILLATLIINNAATAAPTTVVTKEQAASALANIAVPFAENRGQADAKMAFQARTIAGPLLML